MYVSFSLFFQLNRILLSILAKKLDTPRIRICQVSLFIIAERKKNNFKFKEERRSLKVFKMLSKSIMILLISSVILFLIFGDGLFSKEFISTLYLNVRLISKENIYLAYSIYLLIYILATSLSLPIAALLTLIGGAIFSWKAIPIILLGATIGATIIFIAARSFLWTFLEKKITGKFENIRKGLSEDAFYYLLFIRLIPIAPFAIINILAGILNINIKKFILATFIGILPATCIYVWIGKSAGELLSLGYIPNLSKAFWDFLPPLLLIALISLAPILLKKFFKRRKKVQ